MSTPDKRYQYRDTPETSEYIFGSPAHQKTLETWRSSGTGPRYAKAGRRVVYRQDWIDEWLEQRAVTSTAEARRAGIR